MEKEMENVLEYDGNGNLIFEGEYLNGKRNGIGKEYDYYGEIIFEGEYKEGKRWNGKGKEYIENQGVSDNSIIDLNNSQILGNREMIFEGEYLNGKRWKGEGKEYHKDILIFSGEYLDGKRYNGKEYDFNNNNIIYEILNGKRFIDGLESGEINFNVEEIETDNKNNSEYMYLSFEGIKEVQEGDIIEILNYSGELKNGEKNGKGRQYNFEFKLLFEGEFKFGNRNGKGKEYNDKGELIFEGEYLYNYRRKGKEYIKGKLEYEGEYLNEKNGMEKDMMKIII